MSIVGIPFTALGVRLGALLDARLNAFLFVALMLYVGARQWRRLLAEHLPLTRESLWRPLDARTGRIEWSVMNVLVVAAIGAVTGMASGWLGVGGGFIIVPLLQRFSTVSVPGIIATALMVIALVSGGGVLMAVAHGALLPAALVLPFVGAATAGMLAGRRIAKRMSPRLLQGGFTGLVFTVALAMTWTKLLA